MKKKDGFIKTTGMLLAAVFIFGGISAIGTQLVQAAPAGKAQANMESTMAPVNLNKANAEQLVTIRGIGPALAERILQYRVEHGDFKKVEDLINVQGIGTAKLEKIKDQITT